MDPLQSVAMPTHAVLLGLTADNSWLSSTEVQHLYLAYIATNSTQALSIVSMHSIAGGADVRSVSSRRSFSPDYQFGVVVELTLEHGFAPGQSVHITLAQAGATTYYPPQPIQD